MQSLKDPSSFERHSKGTIATPCRWQPEKLTLKPGAGLSDKVWEPRETDMAF